MTLKDNLLSELRELREKRRRLPEIGRARTTRSIKPSASESKAADRLALFFSKQAEKEKEE